MRALSILALTSFAVLVAAPPLAASDAEEVKASEPAAASDAEEVKASEPAAASSAAQDERRERGRSCRVLRKQIWHFEDVVKLAQDRDDELWEQETRRHIERLRARQLRLCPKDVPPSFFDKLGGVVRAAAELAQRAY